MTCQNIVLRNFVWAVGIIREPGSPNNAERETIGYSSAWLHHKGRNKHHYEYWIDYSPDESEGMTGMRMPDRYVVEMVMDRIAASKIYMKEAYTDRKPLEYYERGAAFMDQILHKDTKELLERLLNMLADEGEEKTFDYIREYVLNKKGAVAK